LLKVKRGIVIVDKSSLLYSGLIVSQEVLLLLLKYFSFSLTLRLTITWFPNFNPFVQPFYTLTKITDPYLRIFRGLVPSFLGVDISPIVAIVLLESLRKSVNAFDVSAM
jgi:YggT family protein